MTDILHPFRLSAKQETPSARPPHQSKAFGKGGSGEKLFSRKVSPPDASPSLHSSFTAAAAFHIDPQPPQLDVQAAPRHPAQCGRRPDVASGLPERLKDGLGCARGRAGWRAGEPSPSEAADPPRKREDAVRYWRAVPSRFQAHGCCRATGSAGAAPARRA